MAKLQQILAQIPARMRDTNMSQRIALLLGGALVAISLLWLLNWAAAPERVPLLEQDLQAEELTQVRAGLDAQGQDYEMRGNRVFVPANANRASILARLQQEEKLPANVSTGFAALVKESDPWVSPEENSRRWTYALQTEIEQVLQQFQGVKSARVFLNLNTQPRSFSRNAPPSSASVTLTMKSGEAVPRPLALAAARLVAGAVAGLSPKNVQVLDASGGPALNWEEDSDVALALSKQRRKIEQEYIEKIRNQVPDPKAQVSVVVELVTASTDSNRTTPVSGVPIEEQTTSSETLRKRQADQSGVQPNVGIAIPGGSADEVKKDETSNTKFATGLDVTKTMQPAGDVKQVVAAISLSASYLESVYKRINPGAEAPTDAQLNELFEVERQRVQNQVIKLVKPPSEENVAISRYYDTAPETAPGAGGGGGQLDETITLVKRYGPQGGLALLALLALGMLLRLSRKTDAGESFSLELGLPKEAIEAARQAASDVASIAARNAAQTRRTTASSGGSGGGGGLEGVGVTEVGQAAPTEGMLVAQEVDPSTVQTRKMIDQVTEMASGDAEIVANMVEQWIQKNEQYHDGEL